MTTSTKPERRVLYAEFTALARSIETVSSLLSDYAAKVRSEPGNVVFDCYQRADEPAKFFIFEAYAGEEAFQTHLAAPYGAEFNKALAANIVEPASNLTFLTPMRMGN